MIFTSQTTVEYWPGPWDKELIAIGKATLGALKKKGLSAHVAPFPTQEGVMELVSKWKGYFFLPHSKRARPNLVAFFKSHQIRCFAFELYDTLLQRIEPVPSLDEFDEIVFTSPSTVDGFLKIYGFLPKTKKLTAIGPITKQKMVEEDIVFGIDSN